MPSGGRSLWTLGVLVAIGGCSSSLPPRAELVVLIDTDAPLVGQLSQSPKISPDAAVDSVRIDVLDDQDRVTDTRRFLVPDPADWPLSFGVVPGDRTEVRMRVRVFRVSLATAGSTNGVSTLDPPPSATIERIAHIPVPSEGIARRELLVTEDCLGTPSSFVHPEATCIDAGHLAGAPTDGISSTSGATPTRAGTWKPAFEIPCSGAAPAGRVCVPGGFSILGSTALAGSSDATSLDPIPLRPVVVSPFFLDKYEYTVGRFRKLLSAHTFKGKLPSTASALDPYCTFLGADAAANDDLPLNCIPWETASAICALEGGSLPTEAEWEHEARGRGEGLDYPWGNAEATCCAASLARYSGPSFYAACPGKGLEPVGSHVDASSSCRLADVSRDGVVDMDGSVSEAVQDDLLPYDAPCWSQPGIPRDPVCTTSTSPGHAARGNQWASYLLTPLPKRYLFADYSAMGVRCRYAGTSK